MGVSRASPQWKGKVGRKGATLGMSPGCCDMLERLGGANPKDALEHFFFPKSQSQELSSLVAITNSTKDKDAANMSPCDTQ